MGPLLAKQQRNLLFRLIVTAKNNHNSIVVNKSKAENFSKAIVKLLEDRELYQKLSENALIDIKKNYSLELITKEWDLLFKKLKLTRYN